ncbi:MAG: MFS transporter [Geminicoccaceae bacterium]|nr:MFS transporter [Geminicoccaceae bacterium]
MAGTVRAGGRARGWRKALLVYRDRRVIAVLLLGFSSGLPIMLILTTLSTWLAEAGVDKGTIGLFGFALAPYTFKFAWAPLMDRLPLPPFTAWLGRRRGWMLACQLGLIVSIWWLGQTDPSLDWRATWNAALVVAFFSASQDVVIDAYRIELLPKEKLGAGAGVVVLGYRIAMWAATAGALLLADAAGWSTAYTGMALLVLVGVLTVLSNPEPEGSTTALVERTASEAGETKTPFVVPPPVALRGLGGALLLIVLWLVLAEPVSFLFGLLSPYHAEGWGLGPLVVLAGNAAILGLGLRAGWRLWRLAPTAPADLKSYVLLALACAVIRIVWYALGAQPPFFGEAYGWLLLALIGLLTNTALALADVAPFPLAAFTTPGWVMVLSFWAEFLVLVWVYAYASFGPRTLATFGAAAPEDESRLQLWTRRAVVEPFYDFFHRYGVKTAVAILVLISLFKASDVVLTLMANPFYIELGFTKADIAWVSKTFGLWMTLLGGLAGGSVVFRLGLTRSLSLAVVVMALSNLMFVLLAWQGPNLFIFMAVIMVENVSGGLGTAVFVAYLSALCNVRYTAVQYALLTSFMQLLGKFVIVPSSGYYAESVGWVGFFASSALLSLPALLLVWALRRREPEGVFEGEAKTRPA